MTDKKEILSDIVGLVEKGKTQLVYSLKRANDIGIKSEYNLDELEVFEALCSRYARLLDIYVNKLLRTIDIIELFEEGTRLDSVIRAEKRGFVDEYKLLIKMKDVRNHIVHDYSLEELSELFGIVVNYSNELLYIIEKTLNYIKSKGYL